MAKRTSAMGLIFTAFLFLALPGMLYNNFVNSNLGNTPVLQCSGSTFVQDIPYEGCTSTVSQGCQTNSPNAAPCTVNGLSISVLNANSPFTQMLQGNLFALFTNVNTNPSGGRGSVSSWSGTHGPFDFSGSQIYYSADCIGTATGGSLSQTNWAVGRCTQTNTDNSNVTYANSATWTNWNTNWNTSETLHFFQLGNATFGRTCSWVAQINFTALANGPGFTYYGCTLVHSSHYNTQFPNQPTSRTWGVLIAMPVNNGAVGSGTTHQHVYVQLENWFTQSCTGNVKLGFYASVNCDQFRSGFLGISLGCQAASCSSFVPNSSGGILLGLLAGLVLFVLGLGLQLGLGGGLSVGSNPQGSKFAQILGLGLIIWTVLYSQFSTWFTSGILPYGLDGAAGIISLAVSAMFFGGILWGTSVGGLED